MRLLLWLAMPIPDRTVIRRRLAFSAAVAVVVVIVAALLAGRAHRRPAPIHPAPPPAAAQNAAPAPLDIQTSPLPLPPPPLSRKDLIEAAARAASAYAAGEPAPPTDADLVGRTFRVRIPFGCAGPLDPAAAKPAAWFTFDAKRRIIRLTAQPQVWTKASWIQALAGSADFDAIEGFWLPRPWTDSEDCPPTAPAPEAAPAPQTLGLAMFFAPNSSRVLQRGSRPYEFTGKAPDGDAPVAPRGYRLTLAGRITGFDGSQPVRCRADAPSQRPVCLFAVAFDHVSFEDPATGETLAEWGTN